MLWLTKSGIDEYVECAEQKIRCLEHYPGTSTSSILLVFMFKKIEFQGAFAPFCSMRSILLPGTVPGTNLVKLQLGFAMTMANKKKTSYSAVSRKYLEYQSIIRM